MKSKEIKIEKYLLTKRAVLHIAFLFFILGIVIGANYAMYRCSGTTNIFLFFIILVPIFTLFLPKIRNEITIIKN